MHAQATQKYFESVEKGLFVDPLKIEERMIRMSLGDRHKGMQLFICGRTCSSRGVNKSGWHLIFLLPFWLPVFCSSFLPILYHKTSSTFLNSFEDQGLNNRNQQSLAAHLWFDSCDIRMLLFHFLYIYNYYGLRQGLCNRNLLHYYEGLARQKIDYKRSEFTLSNQSMNRRTLA